MPEYLPRQEIAPRPFAMLAAFWPLCVAARRLRSLRALDPACAPRRRKSCRDGRRPCLLTRRLRRGRTEGFKRGVPWFGRKDDRSLRPDLPLAGREAQRRSKAPPSAAAPEDFSAVAEKYPALPFDRSKQLGSLERRRIGLEAARKAFEVPLSAAIGSWRPPSVMASGFEGRHRGGEELGFVVNHADACWHREAPSARRTPPRLVASRPRIQSASVNLPPVGLPKQAVIAQIS